MATTTSNTTPEAPRASLTAAGIAVAANILVLILSLAIGGEVFLLGEALVGLAVLVTSMVVYRRGRRYTGVGLLGGWIGGMLLAAGVLAIV